MKIFEEFCIIYIFQTTSAPCGRLKSHNVDAIQEGKPVAKNQFSGRTLGVFTSGGDSQGMNATVRAIVRMGLYLGCNVYLIHEVKFLIKFLKR